MSRTWICLRAPLKIENIFPIDSPNGGFSIGKRNAKSQFNSLHIGTGGFSSKYPSQEWKVSMDCAARPIIRKFMEADRTYSDGFIGASSNKKKWTTSLENIQGLPIKKMDHPIDCQA